MDVCTHGFDIQRGRFARLELARHFSFQTGDSSDLPSIMIISVDMQHFLSLDTEHTTDSYQKRLPSTTPSYTLTQKEHIRSDLLVG